MKIIKEDLQLINIKDDNTKLEEVKNELEDSLQYINENLWCDLVSDGILRVYYKKKSLCTIKLDYSEDENIIYIIEDYLGHSIVANENNVIDKIENLLLNLNFIK